MRSGYTCQYLYSCTGKASKVSTCFALGGYGTDALLACGRVGFFIFVLALAPPMLGLLGLSHHAQLLA